MITLHDKYNLSKQHHFTKENGTWFYSQTIGGQIFQEPIEAKQTAYYSLLIEYLKSAKTQIDSDISSLDILIQCGDNEKALKLLREIKQQLDTVKTFEA